MRYIVLSLIFFTTIFASVNLEQFSIYETSKKQTKIKRGDLKIGQSGIIVHKNKNNTSIIIANAYVSQSNLVESTLTITNFDDLSQDALPSTKIVPKDGDIFVLNYLYEASLLIAPNSESFSLSRKIFKNYNFLHSDIFAAHLKIIENPIPSKNDFMEFCKAQNIGTIFFIIDKTAYQVDTKTFKIIETTSLNYDNKEFSSPFYTRVEDIRRGTFDYDDEKIKDYNQHYKKLLGII